jgi:DNA-directed RNA polymerase subunit RPC12/RpoP
MTMFQNLRRMMPERSTLKIECEPCGHQATWSQDQAFRRLGPDATPFEIRRRLRCDECGVRGRSRVWI